MDDSESIDDNPLFESGRPYGLRLRHEPYGCARSPASHAAYMRSINAALANLSHFSAPPVPESVIVGATGSAFAKTTELQVMKLHGALLSHDKEAWEAAIEDEYQRFQKLKVFQVVPRSTITTRSKILTTTWAMKKKANGTYRARLNMRGYEQIANVHYQPEWISAPVTNAVTIRMILVLLLMMGGYAHIVDVYSAFLLGLFDNGEHFCASLCIYTKRMGAQVCR